MTNGPTPADPSDLRHPAPSTADQETEPVTTQLPPVQTNGHVPRRRWRPGRKWLYGLIGLGGIGLAGLALRPAPTLVDVVTVKQADLQVSVEAEGKTRVRDRYVIAAPVDGRLARIDLDAGDQVSANAIVARIDPLPLTSEVKQDQARLQALRAEIAGVETLRPKPEALNQAQARIQVAIAAQHQAEAQLAQAEASWQQAQRELRRANDLLAQGAISQQDQESAALAATARQQERQANQQALEAAKAEVTDARNAYRQLQAEQQDPNYRIDVYQAEIDQVQADLARLADDASRTAIPSPVSGQVLRVMEPSARYVSAGAPILEVGDPNNLELIIDVLSTDAVKIQPGDRIEVNHWGGDHTLTARVAYLEPSAFTKVSALGVDEQRVNVIGEFTDTRVPLADGYRVDTQIVVNTVPNALTVPVSAVFPCDPGTCVFVIKHQRAQLQPVTVGPRNTFDTVIETGLIAGDRVIAYPESVAAGNRVTAR